MFLTRANYTECKSGTHLNTSIFNIISCRSNKFFHAGRSKKNQAASIFKQDLNFLHREETNRMWGVRRCQTQAATTAFLSRTMTYMTECLHNVTNFSGQAIIRSRGAIFNTSLLKITMQNSFSALKTTLLSSLEATVLFTWLPEKDLMVSSANIMKFRPLRDSLISQLLCCLIVQKNKKVRTQPRCHVYCLRDWYDQGNLRCPVCRVQEQQELLIHCQVQNVY